MPLPGTRFRRRALAGTVAAVALTTTALPAPPAYADTSSTLTVVGTSDVFDSNLIQSVIEPDFESTHPGIDLKYVSKGSGAAIQYAEQGAASALLVHAPSLENQFVAAGYSDNNAPGSAFFWGDYVLLAAKPDPAKVAKTDPHDIAGAFEAVANAGVQGKANFVSRGGTPGTTVQEHQIWGLTSGVTLCKVSDVNGGGYSPSTVTGDCPTPIPYPSWYHATGLTQGPNIVNADTCNYPSANNNCYVLTDRGTFNYLQSTGAAQSLKIVVRNNSAAARGGVSALVNSFHGYAVNPAAFPADVAAGINEPAAQAFLAFVTSPAEQARIGQYLGPDAPFLPDAAPKVTITKKPVDTTGSKMVTISGTISNVVPGTPPLANKPVALFATDPVGGEHQLGIVTTTSQGVFTFKVSPEYSATYAVHTDQITQLEYPDLDPQFYDLLAPQTQVIGDATVTGLPTIKKAVVKTGQLTLTGTVAPAAVDHQALLTLLVSSNGGTYNPAGQVMVNPGDTRFTKSFTLASGTYSYKLSYEDDPYIELGFSAVKNAVVP